jgi:ABC-type nickel/cobalt efflux system permease component RcnA
VRTTLVAALLLAAAVAGAHPLGNFTTNRLVRVTVGADALDVHYVVDLAELPAYRALAEMDTDRSGAADDAERAAWAARAATDIARSLHVTVDGAALALRAASSHAETVPGAAGLPTLRLELDLAAPLPNPRGAVDVDDDNFAGLPGWHEVIVTAADGVAIEGSTAADVDRTNGLRSYPQDLLAAPPQAGAARFSYRPGVAPAARASGQAPSRSGAERFGDRLTALVADRRPLSASLVASALLVALVLGAFHALTPGHGKTIVGAYLVGARVTWRHAVFLGLVVTATHTLGVYVLGLATLVASAWVLPERLLPWMSAVSGLLVVAVGASLLRSRLETALHGHTHDHGHHHDGEHVHGHSHVPPADMAPTARNLLALGVSGGILPCPSALVVLLGAIALGRAAFGLLLILAFSAGLAAVLTTIGLALVYARGLFDRLPIDGRVARYMPVASAAVISLAGLAILVEALARIGA